MQAPPSGWARRGACALSLVVMVAVGVACEGPPTPPLQVFTVTTVADGADVDPGDGTCEDADGECTLRAAVEEANTGPGARVVLPDDHNHLDSPLTVTGTVHLEGPGGIADGTIHLAAGGFLVLDRFDLAGSDVQVDGTLLLRRSNAAGVDREPVVVHPGGTAVIQRSWLFNLAGPALRNDGTAAVTSSTFGWGETTGIGSTPPGQLTNGAGGHTELTATWFGSHYGPNCAGPAPISRGYNADPDDSCGLDQPTDRHDAPLVRAFMLRSGPHPPVGSTVLDAIPFGTADCTALMGTDRLGVALPQDGDGDGTAACDIGANELPAP